MILFFRLHYFSRFRLGIQEVDPPNLLAVVTKFYPNQRISSALEPTKIPVISHRDFSFFHSRSALSKTSEKGMQLALPVPAAGPGCGIPRTAPPSAPRLCRRRGPFPAGAEHVPRARLPELLQGIHPPAGKAAGPPCRRPASPSAYPSASSAHPSQKGASTSPMLSCSTRPALRSAGVSDLLMRTKCLPE